jgi:hypothetical protein
MHPHPASERLYEFTACVHPLIWGGAQKERGPGGKSLSTVMHMAGTLSDHAPAIWRECHTPQSAKSAEGSCSPAEGPHSHRQLFMGHEPDRRSPNRRRRWRRESLSPSNIAHKEKPENCMPSLPQLSRPPNQIKMLGQPPAIWRVRGRAQPEGRLGDSRISRPSPQTIVKSGSISAAASSIK